MASGRIDGVLAAVVAVALHAAAFLAFQTATPSRVEASAGGGSIAFGLLDTGAMAHSLVSAETAELAEAQASADPVEAPDATEAVEASTPPPQITPQTAISQAAIPTAVTPQAAVQLVATVPTVAPVVTPPVITPTAAAVVQPRTATQIAHARVPTATVIDAIAISMVRAAGKPPPPKTIRSAVAPRPKAVEAQKPKAVTAKTPKAPPSQPAVQNAPMQPPKPKVQVASIAKPVAVAVMAPTVAPPVNSPPVTAPSTIAAAALPKTAQPKRISPPLPPRRPARLAKAERRRVVKKRVERQSVQKVSVKPSPKLRPVIASTKPSALSEVSTSLRPAGQRDGKRGDIGRGASASASAMGIGSAKGGAGAAASGGARGQDLASLPGGDNAAEANARRQYAALVRGLLERVKRYPNRAKARGRQGIAVVRFNVDRAGRVSGVGLSKGSGAKSLDRETLAMLKRVGQFPAFPAAIARKSLDFVFPIAFSLR